MKSLKQMLDLANNYKTIEDKAVTYSVFNETIKNYSKVNKLLKPEIVEHCENNGNYFQFKKPTEIGRKGFWIGSVELIIKNTSRFDVTQFKKDNPDLYNKYLVGGVSNELRTNHKKELIKK